MEIQTKKTWEEKEATIINDQVGLFAQAKDLVMQAFYACIVRDVMKEYRYRRAEKLQKYNTVATFSHVALENLALLQLWKLFDEKNSAFHVWYIVERLPHPALKAWFDEQIAVLQPDIDYLSAWRHNFVGHRSAIGHFSPVEFEKKMNNALDSENCEERIKDFLLNFLCRIKFEVKRLPIEQNKEALLLALKDYRSFVENDRDEILQNI